MSKRSCERALMVLAAAAAGAGCDLLTGPGSVLTIDVPTSTEVVVGELVTLTASGSDPLVPRVWSSTSESVATVSGGVFEALRPGSVEVVVRAGDARDALAMTVVPREGGYGADEVDYFLEISLGFEFGNASRIVRKWGEDVRYRVNGSPTPEDLATLADVVADLNALTSAVDLVEDSSAPAVEIHFAPQGQFPSILPSYTPGNIGYFSVWWGADQVINRAVVLIASDQPQSVRDHLVREEVTQMLGMARDSYRYPESIFQQAYSTVAAYAPIDEAVIEILYRPEILVGMDERTAGRTARRLIRGVTSDAAPLVAGAGPRGVPGAGAGSHGRGR